MNQTISTAAKIGLYVRYQREKKELSLSEFGELIGVTPSFLLRLEQGVYKTIKLDVVEKIAKGFQMSVADFLAKCQIGEQYVLEMPALEFYLKEKYQFPSEAIKDSNLFIEFLRLKYKAEIATQLKQHKEYWRKMRT